MARPDIKTSIHGRRFGLGEHDQVVSGDQNVQAASTSANLAPVGVHTLTSTSAVTYTLDAPAPGNEVILSYTSTGTVANYVTLDSGNFLSTAGSSATTILFSAQGQHAHLRGVSTALWQVLSHTSSAALTTST